MTAWSNASLLQLARLSLFWRWLLKFLGKVSPLLCQTLFHGLACSYPLLLFLQVNLQHCQFAATLPILITTFIFTVMVFAIGIDILILILIRLVAVFTAYIAIPISTLFS